MATIDSPSQGGVSQEVDPTFRSGRVSILPHEYVGLSNSGVQFNGGHFRVQQGAAAQLWSANANLACIRYAPTTAVGFMVLHKINVQLIVASAITTSQSSYISLNIARGFTAAPTTNVTVTPVGGNGRARTSMGMSSATIYASSTAAGFSGHTATLDPIFQYLSAFTTGTAAGGTNSLDVYTSTVADVRTHPIILAPQEGVFVQWGPVLASGSMTVFVNWDWSEVPSF